MYADLVDSMMKQCFQDFVIRFITAKCLLEGLVGRQVISPTQIAKFKTLACVNKTNHQSKETAEVTPGGDILECF